MQDETQAERTPIERDAGAAASREQLPVGPAARSRFRWHASTWFVAILVAATFALLGLPGSRGDNCARMHGWPWVCLTRGATLYLAENRTEFPDIWSVWNDVLVFHPILLCLNLCVALIVAVGCAAVFERWRRRRTQLFRFSLRSVMLLVVACSLPMGYIAHRASLHRQRQVVLEQLLDFPEEHVEVMSILPEWQRSLIQDLVGEDFRALFDDPASMEFYKPELTAKDIGLVGHLSTLKTLRVVGGSCPDDALARLADLRQLEILDLRYLHVTDTTLHQLPNLRQLKAICLGASEITDAGLQNLKRFPNLHSISLKGTSVTNAGVEQFRREVGREIQIER